MSTFKLTTEQISQIESQVNAGLDRVKAGKYSRLACFEIPFIPVSYIVVDLKTHGVGVVEPAQIYKDLTDDTECDD